MWGVPLYIAEAFGFRKVVDATFMIGFLITGFDVSASDVEKYLAALRRAQMEIDLHPELYKHYHLRAVPEKYREQVDVRALRPGRAHRLPAVYPGGLRRDPAVDAGPQALPGAAVLRGL